MKTEPYKAVVLITESQALHIDLIDLGFVRVGFARTYVYEDQDGVINLPESVADTYDQVIRFVGQTYFNRKMGSEKSRKLHFHMSQQLICRATEFADRQIEKMRRKA